MSHKSINMAKNRAAMSVQPNSILMLCAMNPWVMLSIIAGKSA